MSRWGVGAGPADGRAGYRATAALTFCELAMSTIGVATRFGRDPMVLEPDTYPVG
ncbi:MAG: hypothetical protein M3Z00_05795 [Actinomycetota bacterium]|nr:hypothetical protein [Actinomycetota bacterium]